MSETTHTYKFKKGGIVSPRDIYRLKDLPINKPWFNSTSEHYPDIKISRDIEFKIIIKES